MAFSDARWSNALCCKEMFFYSPFEEGRHNYDDSEDEEKISSNKKLCPSVPVWWPYDRYSTTSEPHLMYQHFVDPSTQLLSRIYAAMKTPVHMSKFTATTDGNGDVSFNYSSRSRREMIGMPILNYVSVGGPVTKLETPSTVNPLREEFLQFHGSKSRSTSYSFEERFVEPLLPLIVHYYFEVLHGPDYIHTLKRDRFRDSLLCLGNLKAFCSLERPVVDKLAMDYMFSARNLPEDLVTAALEVPCDSFNYEEYYVQEKMMYSPSDVGSVVRFFSNVMIVSNVMTSHDVRTKTGKNMTQLFATKVASLFETIEDKTPTQHSANIGLYGMFLFWIVFIKVFSF